MPPFAVPAAALTAGLIGLASAHADDVVLRPAIAAGSVVLAITAHAGFCRTTSGAAARLPATATVLHALLTLVLPAAFLLLLVSGTDYLQRGTLAWTPFAAGLSFALLTSCLPLVIQFARREEDIASGRPGLATALAPSNAKLALFGVALPAYGWLVLQVGRYNLPQGCAAAAITLLLSFHAVRIVREHASEPGELVPAIRLAALTAPLHGLILAAALVLDGR